MLGAIVKKLLNGLTFGVLDRVLGHLERQEARRLEAMNDEQKRAHEAREAARQRAKEVRLATAHFWEMRLIAFLIVLPFVVHLWSVWIDTQLAAVDWGIPPFPAPFDEWQREILLSFFGVSGLVGSARVVAGAIAYRRR